jgi:hypothetical protein
LIHCKNAGFRLFTQLTIPRFEVKQTGKLNLTSYSGLALIGRCCPAAQVEAVIDPRLPLSQGMRTSDIVKSMVGLLSLTVERTWQRHKRNSRLVVQVTERTSDKRGQRLLVPEIDLQGWWTSLEVPAEQVVKLYQQHGTHEQCHSAIKTDLDLERLPSGKFDTNDAIVHLASFADDCLRLLGQPGLTGEIAPIRHPAKRRRLKTVLQEIMCRAAKFVAHARRLVLDFGRGFAKHVRVFVAWQDRLLKVASP